MQCVLERRGRIVLLAIAAALLCTSSPSTARKAKDEKPAVAATQRDLVWPLPPDPPRIRWVAEHRGLADFARPTSRWRRLLLGPETDKAVSLRKPYGVATDAAGRIYVTDSAAGAVFVFDEQARQVTILGNHGRLKLVTPIGIVVDDHGTVFVADAGQKRVFALDSRGEVTLGFGGAENLGGPAGLALDQLRERLYVADSQSHRLLLYRTDGTFIASWGTRGSAPGQFNYPTNVAVSRDGTVCVTDTGNFRVQLFDPAGNHLSSFGGAGDGPGRFHRPKGIGVDSLGHLYVADAAFNNFQIFDRGGALLLDVGSTGTEAGRFWLPAGLHVDRRDRVYVVDQANARLQVFEYLPEARPTPTGGTASPSAPGSRPTTRGGGRQQEPANGADPREPSGVQHAPATQQWKP